MRLCDFILAHSDGILSSWVAFIRSNGPAAGCLDDADLRDHAHPILSALAHALDDGVAQAPALDTLEEAARAHAVNRVRQGFTLDQIIAEFRARSVGCRASLDREIQDFGRQSHHDIGGSTICWIGPMAVSTAHYAMRLELARDLFLGVLGHDLRTPLAAIAHSAVAAAAVATLRTTSASRRSNGSPRVQSGWIS